MTTVELIEALKAMPQSAPVVFYDGDLGDLTEIVSVQVQDYSVRVDGREYLRQSLGRDSERLERQAGKR